MKKINNEQILDRIYDLADAKGMKINDFMTMLEEDYGDIIPDTEGLPQEIADELNAARESKKEMRKQARIQKSEQEAADDIKKFRELFPDVSAEDIPESVWEEVSKGESLVSAYALYKITEENLTRHAQDVNGRNARMGAKAVSDGSTEPVFTKEAVEKMSGKDVKKNYKNILQSMKNWKL